jgi:hypothetical protein
MKKTIFKSILIAGLFGAWACNDANPKPEGGTSKDSVVAEKSTTTQFCERDHYTELDVAVHHIENYACYLKRLKESRCDVNIDTTRAFLISKCDLLSVLGVPIETTCAYDHVRAYFGLTDNNTPKLYLTPVRGADPAAGNGGEDVILEGPPGSGLPAQYVLELNFPCPNLCATNNSPLNRTCAGNTIKEGTPAKK